MTRFASNPRHAAKRARESTLADRMHRGDLAARNELIAGNIGVIVSLVARRCPDISERRDVVQEALLGITRNAARFDPRRAEFQSFVAPWAMGGRICWRKKSGYFGGRTDARVDSADAPIPGLDLTLADSLAAEPDDSLDRADLARTVRRAIESAGLTERERLLVETMLADGWEAGSALRAAARIGVSRERARQLLCGHGGTIGVFKKLRAALEPVMREAA